MIELATLLDLISDRQLQEYVAWLEAHPDSDEEESIAYLMDILNNSQVDILLEKDFNATPYWAYSSWYGACIHPDGRCFESTLTDCNALGGSFQGPGTSCGGHYSKPVMMGAEQVDRLPRDGDDSYEKELWVGNDSSQANAAALNYLQSKYPDEHHNIKYILHGSSDYNKVWLIYSFATDEMEYNAPPGKVFHDPAAAHDPRLKNDNPPSSVTQYLRKHPEVANLYDDDDASVMVKGIIIGCLIGALGTIFGNLASEMIMDKFKIRPQFKWDQ